MSPRSVFSLVLAAIVGVSARLAVAVVLVAAIVAGASLDYALRHFALNTDTTKLVSRDLEWRKAEDAFDAIFPQPKNQILVVIDGVTPELTHEAALAIEQALTRQPDLFLSVRRLGGGPFLDRHGLLFLPREETREAVEQIIAAQPFLGALASDPSLRGIMTSLSTALIGVERGEIGLERLARPIAQINATLGDFLAGRPAVLSWRRLMMEGEPDLRETRLLIEALVRLDFGALRAGGKPSEAIREAARALSAEGHVKVRLTGPVPIFDEEFATLTENAVLIAAAVISAILVMLWLALRSPALMASILATIAVGLAATTALGLHLVGAFNIISVAFIALFVGLGIDFGIQFCVRYRAESVASADTRESLRRAGAGLGPSLTLAALAIAAGFFGFLPTSYRGVAELGLVSGIGMMLTFVLTVTFLPALVVLLRPALPGKEVGLDFLAPLDRVLARVAPAVLAVSLMAGAGGLALLPSLSFDFNLLNLRSREVESVATLLDLSQDPSATPNTMDTIALSREEAKALAQSLSALPEVERVLTIDDLLPADQEEKLALIAEAAMLLDPSLNPFSVAPPPDDAAIKESLGAVADALRRAASASEDPVAGEAGSLAERLDRLASAPAEMRAAAAAMLTRGLVSVLERVRNLLSAGPVTLESLPADLKRDFLAPAGEVRVKIFPKGDPTDTEMLSRFRAAVAQLAPNAVGAPVSLEESGDTIVGAFVEAGLWSLLAIALLLWLALRRLRDVALALLPLTLAGILTLATCVTVGMKLNYANIIALPLLFGIGVAFDIYFVMAWRNGVRNLLQSPLARAVIFSAGATATGFGALWFSSHPGTASMGALLLISLGWILFVVLFVLPPLLHVAGGAGSQKIAK